MEKRAIGSFSLELVSGILKDSDDLSCLTIATVALMELCDRHGARKTENGIKPCDADCPVQDFMKCSKLYEMSAKVAKDWGERKEK